MSAFQAGEYIECKGAGLSAETAKDDKERKTLSKRIVYADILRIAAAFTVVVLHTSGIRLMANSVESGGFFWSAFYDSAARWAVPVFIMLSGMLFLDKNKKLNLKKLYTKNAARIVTAFLFWSYVYNFYEELCEGDGALKAFLAAIPRILQGSMHLWFVFVIIGLYIALPFIKKLTDNMTERETELFLILSFLTAYLPASLSAFGKTYPIAQYIGKFEISIASGFTGLFVGGGYISSYRQSKKRRIVIYLLALASLFYTFIATVLFSREAGALDERFFNTKSAAAVLMAMGVFVFAKYGIGKIKFSLKFEKIIGYVSSLTFGIYLTHEIMVRIISQMGIFVLNSRSYVGIPLEAAAVFVAAAALTALIKLTPLGKYIA